MIGTLEIEQMSRTETRVAHLAQLIADIETAGNKSILGSDSDIASLNAGSLVYNPKLGVTILVLNCITTFIY